MVLNLTLAERRFALPSALGNARSRWTERRGLVVTLERENGEFGQGEATPLPGYSDHTLDACRDAFAELSGEALEPLTTAPLGELGVRVAAIRPTAPPEVHFALETALLDLRARQVRLPLFRLLGELVAPITETDPTASAGLPLVALLGPAHDGWENETHCAVQAGYAGVKAKVGAPGALAAELAALARVRAALGPERCLRLDANGALTYDALAEFRGCSPEFVEEPFALGTTWGNGALPVPVALDESLRLGIDAAAEHSGVVAWVLKLGPLGGFSRALAFVRAARERNIDVVVSHTLEGPIALAAAAALALALGPGRFAAGLAPHAGIDPADLPPAYRGATLAPHARPGLGLRRINPKT